MKANSKVLVGVAIALGLAFFVFSKSAAAGDETPVSTGAGGGVSAIVGVAKKIFGAVKKLLAPAAAAGGAGVLAGGGAGFSAAAAGGAIVTPGGFLIAAPAAAPVAAAGAGVVPVTAGSSVAAAAGAFSAVGAGVGAVGLALWINGAVKALKSLFSSGWWEGTPEEISERKKWEEDNRVAAARVAAMGLSVGIGKGVLDESGA